VTPRDADDAGRPGAITFDPLTRDRFDLLGRWLAAPHVARWWNHDPAPSAVERDFGPTADGLEPAADFIVLLEGEPVGLIQYCLIKDFPEYVEELDGVAPIGDGTATIDYLVGDLERTGNRLGTTMIRAFIDHVWATRPEADEILVPVNAGNVASWRALLAAGFALVGKADLEPDVPGDDRQHQILRVRRPDPPGTAVPH
jgi:aminoglycoside 6'-N-acetyltransferase